MKRVLLLSVWVIASILTQEAFSTNVFPTNLIQLAYFYKRPADGNLDVLVKNFKDYVLSKGDESVRDTLKSKGLNTPFLQYIIMNKIHDPGSCTATPNNNSVAWFTGDFCNISSQHPDWFLLDTYGNRIVHNTPAGKYYCMDPGNSGWRSFFLSRAKQAQETLGWDGLFLDVVEVSLTELRGWGQLPKKYPDNASYANAVHGMLLYLYSSYFQAQGRPLIPNLGGYSDVNLWWNDVYDSNGAMVEAFAAGWGSSGYRSTTKWLEQLSLAEKAQSLGKRLILVSQGSQSDYTRQQFCYGSYLLIANGNAAFRYSSGSSYNKVWLYPNYNLPLGKPVGARFQSGGLWIRNFETGRVSVDPVAHTATISTNSVQSATAFSGSLLQSPMKTSGNSNASQSSFVGLLKKPRK